MRAVNASRIPYKMLTIKINYLRNKLTYNTNVKF